MSKSTPHQFSKIAGMRVTALAMLLCVGVWALNAWAQTGQRPPPDGGGGDRRGPPPEMIAACVSKQAGSACSAVGPQGRAINGTCMTRRNATDGRLACRPGQDPAGRPDGQQGPPEQANRPQQQHGQVIATTDPLSYRAPSYLRTPADTSAVLCNASGNAQNSTLNLPSNFRWSCANGQRSLVGNGIPNHAIGAFPNSDNPNKVAVQNVSYAITLQPAVLDGVVAQVKDSGMAINGIRFDPGTGGSCPSPITSLANCSMDRGPGQWRMEALGQSSFRFGVDANNAHVQPDGSYHYHGLPTGLLSGDLLAGRRMQLIGWAADGFPMYALYGPSDANSATSVLRKMRASYRLKANPEAGRPALALVPMGAFVQDYEFVAGVGDLDQCNGRFAATPEFPKGIYHYYVTDSYPYVQRCVRGTPNRTGPNRNGPDGPGASQGLGQGPSRR